MVMAAEVAALSVMFAPVRVMTSSNAAVPAMRQMRTKQPITAEHSQEKCHMWSQKQKLKYSGENLEPSNLLLKIQQ